MQNQNPYAPRVPRSLILLIWYFASARSQQRYVQEKFGTDYPRKGWVKPPLRALLATIGLLPWRAS